MLKRRNAAGAEWLKAANAFDETNPWVSVVCGNAVTAAVHNLAVVGMNIASKLIKGEDIYDKERADFAEKPFAARDAIREELRIDALEQPPPSEVA